MNAQPFAHRRWRQRCLTPLLGLTLLACSQGTKPAPPPASSPDRLDTLVIGAVQSTYVDALKPSLNMVQYTGSQKPEDYNLVLFDGDANSPTDVAAHPVLAQALRAGKWVLGVDLTEAHKKQGIQGLLHASTCGTSTAFAFHTGYDAHGRFQAHIIEPSRAESQPKETRLPTDRTDTPQPATKPTKPGQQACEGTASATSQSLKPDPGSPQVFARTLLEAIAKPTPLVRQDTPATIPNDLIYANFYFTETFNQPLSGSLKGYPGTQHPNYTVNRTFTVYLNNKNNPQGDFQYVLLEQDAAANPKLSSEPFIAMGTKWDSDWVIGSYDEAGWAQNRMQLSLSANPTDWTLVSTSPDTVNGTTNVTTGVSFNVQFGANADGPNGSGSFTYSNSQSRDISDWAVSNLATNTETQWMYMSKNPVDGNYQPNCTAAIRTTGCYLGQLPNDLA
ncbi:hypothetical protein E7T09_15740 [Deinococcus sp. KSM4-11]|uniref:hypothetical protein n=1 Tax=Deinococcus sp. KSM4-11 TaxID=2568654 RepID=UPI0010A58942|nr:hypothetical protein [Deinococcus sp. KSM4-11]THF85420.1 hypothetical protein E7T09_15740 [Deinococcus sp. KSM4-11]